MIIATPLHWILFIGSIILYSILLLSSFGAYLAVSLVYTATEECPDQLIESELGRLEKELIRFSESEDFEVTYPCWNIMMNNDKFMSKVKDLVLKYQLYYRLDRNNLNQLILIKF